MSAETLKIRPLVSDTVQSCPEAMISRPCRSFGTRGPDGADDWVVAKLRQVLFHGDEVPAHAKDQKPPEHYQASLGGFEQT